MKGYVHENGSLEVVLSERNLLTLLAKVRRADSAATLVKFDTAGAHVLVVRAEDDETHYGARTPGPMHPLEEEFLKRVQPSLEPAPQND